jgi:DNA ligase-1
VNDSILLTALAHAVHLHKRGATGAELADALEGTAQAVRQAFSECPSFEILINAMLDHDLDDLPQHCHFKIGKRPTLSLKIYHNILNM